MSRRELARGRLKRYRPWFLVDLGLVAVIGVVGGIVWNRLVVLPSYTIDDDFRATIPESGLRRIAAIDVHFTLIGLVAGLIIGTVAWFLFRRTGWLVTLFAAVGAGLAGLITRMVGQSIGPGDFAQRIATATKGDLVRIDFAAHSWVPLAVWIGAAMVPVVVGSLIWRNQDWIVHVPVLPEGAEGVPSRSGETA